MKKIAALGLVALLFGGCSTTDCTTIGCTPMEPVDPTRPADVGDGVLVWPQVAWGRGGSGNDQFWTIDGIGQNELHFYTGIASGSAISDNGPKATRTDLGFYRDNMLPNDVMYFIVRSLEGLGYTNVQAANLARASFGSATGFRFDLTMDTIVGLHVRGEALATQRNGRLDLILFLAPAGYPFAKLQPTVEAIFRSVQLSGG